jgi:hypothetical protein
MTFKHPRPTHYTTTEGGDWILWNSTRMLLHRAVRAIRFDDDTIFDLFTGTWRPYLDPQVQAANDFIEGLWHEFNIRGCLEFQDRVTASRESFDRVVRAFLADKTIEVKK